jgi:formate dehydrogenase maturation protein FdhE
VTTVVDYYALDSDSRVKCSHCRWKGVFRDLHASLESEEHYIWAYTCPTCHEDVLLTQLPTLQEIRAAAARGNSRAIVDLANAEENHERSTGMQGTLPRSADKPLEP